MRRALLLAALALAACGGGGPESPPAPPDPVGLGNSVFGQLFRLFVIPAAEGRIERTAIDPDGTRLAVGDSEGTVRIYDRATMGLLAQRTLLPPGNRWEGTPHEGFAHGSDRRITGLRFLAGAAKVLAANGYGRVARIDASNGGLEATQELPVPVASMAVHEATDRLAVGTDLGGIQEFSLSSFAFLRENRIEDDHGEGHFVRYLPDGTGLLSALRDYDPAADGDAGGGGTIFDAGLTLWNAATGLRQTRFGGPPGTAGALFEPGSGRILAGTQEGIGAGFDLGGAPVAGSFPIYLAPALISAGGSTQVVSLHRSRIRILRAPDFLRVWEGEDPGLPSPMNPATLGSSEAAPYFSVGRRDGTVAVYRYDPTPGADGSGRASPVDQDLGAALGVTVHVSRELIGLSTAVREITPSPSGRYLATRDDAGSAVLWDLAPPAPVHAGPGVAGVLPGVVATSIPGGAPLCPPHAATFSYGPGEQSLWRVNEDGSLTRFDLPAMTNPLPVQPTDLGAPFSAVAALEAAPGQLVVAADDGSVRLCDPTGNALQMIVAPTNGPTPHPFRTLLLHPDGQRVFAAPDEYVPEFGQQEPIQVFQVGTWQRVGACFHPFTNGTLAFAQNGGLVVLGERYERRGIAFFDGLGLGQISEGSPLAPRAGFGGPIGDLVLGAEAASLTLLRPGPPIQSISIPIAGRLTSCAAAPAIQRAFVGLSTGGILELSFP